MQFGKVKKLLRNAEGRPILGMANEDPLLNTRQYVVEPHCLKSLFTADNEGTRLVLLDKIIDHRRGDGALYKAVAIVIMKNGVKRRRHTTQGWQLLYEWKGGTSSNRVALKMPDTRTRSLLQNTLR